MIANRLTAVHAISCRRSFIIILMLNCNKLLRQSLERTQKSHKAPHTASINLMEASYSEAIHLPLREALHKKITDNSHHADSHYNGFTDHKKNVGERNQRAVDKSLSSSQKINKENQKYKHKDMQRVRNQKFKLLNQPKIQTDRNSLRKCNEKSIKTIRLKTDYSDNFVASQAINPPGSTAELKHKVSNRQIEEDKITTQKVCMSKAELKKIYQQFRSTQKLNEQLKRQLNFYHKGITRNKANPAQNSVIKALY